MSHPQLVAFRWTTDPSPVALEVRHPGADATTLVPLGDRVRFRILPGRRCTGRVDFVRGVIRACPHDASVDGSHQCGRCREAEGYGPCLLCTGYGCPSLAPAVARFCQGPHHLYLACFGEPWIKVGTTAASRRYQRVLEQGPLAVAFVASAPGPIIKRMEHQLAERGYVTRVSRATKRRLMASRMHEEDARALVMAAAEQARTSLTNGYHTLLSAPELVARPLLATGADGRDDVRELEVGDGLHVDARVVAVRGHTLVLDDGPGLASIDLSALRGRSLDFSPPAHAAPPARQMSLF